MEIVQGRGKRQSYIIDEVGLLTFFLDRQEIDVLGQDACERCKWTGKEALSLLSKGSGGGQTSVDIFK